MVYFKWDKPFELGIDKVDREHHRLVDIVNNLGEAITSSFSGISIQDIVDELADYASTHFKNEEALMVKHDVDERHVREHKSTHRQFISDVARMKTALNNGDTIVTSKYLLNYLINWLSFHILVTDKNMAHQMKEIISGVDPVTAYDEQEKHFDSSLKPLITAVNGLFSQLTKSNIQLRNLNEKLDIKVAERTAELHEANMKLEKLSLTDQLTQLPNRRHVLQQLQLLWDEAEREHYPLSCMMIDADYFKVVNDELGHEAGDKVLFTIARELKNSTRSDDIVARLGGDEFFVICPNTTIEGATQLSATILKRIFEIKNEFPELHWNSSISIGVAEKDQSHNNINDLIKTADKSVYKAKEAGRGCCMSVQTASK